MLREERHGATVVLTLDYPERRNALAVAMRERFVEALERLEGDNAVRAIVITGAGGTFSAGGDISGMNVSEFGAGRERFRTTHRMVRLMIEGSKPIIAAVEGWAVGAGLGVALCCDTVVSGDTAKFMTGFGKIGLIADFGLLHTLPRRVGEGRARQILMYGEQMDAAIAERIGLIDHVVPAGSALEAAMARAEKFHQAAPLPLAMTKAFLAKGLAESLDWERTVQSTLFLTSDHVEGREAFMAKRKPVFKGA
jgi:2-(1,2-epoxy-1,2-dihydrophenyl)acetyl-CoA isomerase